MPQEGFVMLFKGRIRFLSAVALLFFCACSASAPRTNYRTSLPADSRQETTRGEAKGMKDKSAQLLARQGMSYLENGNLSLARLHLVAALGKEEKFLPALSGMGEVSFREGDLRQSENYFRAALAQSPEHVPALVGLGKIYRSGGHNEKALENFQNALYLQPADPEILTEMAITHDLAGAPKKAEPLHRQVAELKSDNTSYNNLGFNYLLQERYPEAIEAFRNAMKFNSRDRRTLNNLAMSHALNGQEREALKIFEKSIGEAAAWNNLGYVYMTAGLWEKAEKAFRKALDLEPKFYVRASENLKQLQSLKNQ